MNLKFGTQGNSNNSKLLLKFKKIIHFYEDISIKNLKNNMIKIH